jgi:UDP-N-acetylmuramate dehydrogenase
MNDTSTPGASGTSGIYSSDPASACARLKESFPGLVETQVSLAEHSSFGVGGPADLFARVRTTAQLCALVKEAAKLAMPFEVIGAGTNLLIADKGCRGLVICNSIMGLEISGAKITIGAGEDYMTLVNAASEVGLTGMEFAAGIWGTVGGAVVGNAGAYGSEICDVLTQAEIVDRKGGVRIEKTPYFEFEYRNSKLKKSREIVVSATVELKFGDKDKISARVQEILAIRGEKHPRIPNSAGSFFKNIIDPTQPHGKLPAGKLLDEIGAKEFSQGGARVYEKHANILINSGTATAQDIRKLADILSERTLEKHGIRLEEEVVSLGEFD